MEGISFIIYSSNNAKTIERSIKSIIQTIPPTFNHFSINVFDKSSRDGTAGILKKLSEDFDAVSVVYDPIGGLEIQQVFDDSLAEYIIVLDANARLEEGCIDNLVNTLRKSQDIMLVGAKVILRNHTLGRGEGVYAALSRRDSAPGNIRYTYHHLPDTFPLGQIVREREFISTLCYAVRTNDFHKLFPDGTDLRDLNLRELCLRIKQKTGRISYHPGAAVLKFFDSVPAGTMFEITPPNSSENSDIPGLEQEIVRIRKDLEVALAQNRVNEVFSTRKSGFKGYFFIENDNKSIRDDRIIIKSDIKQARINFQGFQLDDKGTLIVMAEVESEEENTLILKYKTKVDPAYSDKKRFSSKVYPGRQMILFSFVSDYLWGDLCFEIELHHNFIIHSIELYSYNNPPRDKSLVSVVIPCYNHGNFIGEALDSLKAIDKEKYEVIIVNDGSNDPETLEKIRELEARGYFVVHQENKGLGAARNEGIRRSKGNYILPLDCDNKIRPVYINRGIEVLDMHSEYGIVYGDVQRFGDSDEIVRVGEFVPSRLLVENKIDACALFRKEAWEQVGGYEEKMVGYQDWAFWMAIAAKGNWNFFHIDDIVFDYRVRDNSMVSNTKRFHYQLLEYMLARNISFFRREFYKIYKDHYPNNGIPKIKRKNGHDTLFGSIRIHLQHFITNRLRINNFN